MFSKTSNNPTPPTPGAPAPTKVEPAPAAPDTARSPASAPRAQKLASLIASDMTLEGSITGGGEVQIDGTIKGDVRVEKVTVGDGGTVEGGIYAESVEVRGKVSGSITAKQVRLYGACHVDGDISHEQLAMETGAFFQGRSLRLQRPATVASQTQAALSSARVEPIAAPAKDNGNGARPATPPL